MRRRLAGLALLLVGCGDGGRAMDAAIDVALAACGIEEPGARCGGATSLERCDGTAVVTETCAGAMVCVPDPATGRGAACVAPGADCGAITAGGACSGPVYARCGKHGLAAVDCTTLFARCGQGGCTTDCLDRGVPAQGRCAGGGIERCVFEDGQFRVAATACPAATACVDQGPDSAEPSCAPVPGCGVGAQGSCLGDTLVRCAGATTQAHDCAADGLVCAWTGDLGYACVAAGTVGQRQLDGVVRYEDRVPSLGGLGPPVARPVRGAGVTLIDDASGRALAASVTSDDGRFLLRHDAAEGSSVHVLVVSASPARARPVRVLRPDGLLHGVAGPSQPSAAAASVELLITARSGLGGAFNILDELVAGMDALRTTLPVAEPTPVVAVWAPGLTTKTQAGLLVIFVQGTVADDDAYDDAVILHEFGHTVERTYGRGSSPGMAHSLGVAEDPRLAWSEGFASYWSSVARADPRYVDTNALGAFGFDLEGDVTAARADLDETQDVSESTVSEILWHLGAPASHAAVVGVEPGWLAGGSAPDRGVVGVDLVDFLDGYLALGGPCAGVRAVLAARAFPYDFQGPTRCLP